MPGTMNMNTDFDMHTHTYIYIHINTHTHIYIYIHINTHTKHTKAEKKTQKYLPDLGAVALFREGKVEELFAESVFGHLCVRHPCDSL